MAKRVRVSIDSGVTFYTLPGNTGDLKNDAGSLDDTIFGQDYSSSQTGLISWTVSANGLYKGFAGYVATIMKTGTPTPFTAEAATHVGGQVYQITDATKRIWDRTTPAVVKDGASILPASDIASIDYLFGTVTLAGSYTVLGTITFGGKYLAKTIVGCVNTYTLTQKANATDVTCMTDAQGNGGNRVYDYGLKTVQLELKGIKQVSDDFITLLQNRAEVLIEICPDGGGLTVARGWFKPMSTDQTGKVGDPEEMTLSYDLSVPDDSTIPYPFHWAFASGSTLNQAIKNCISSWEDNDLIAIQYLEDGVDGKGGDCVITDLSLAGGLEAMNEFTVNFQGSGAIADAP